MVLRRNSVLHQYDIDEINKRLLISVGARVMHAQDHERVQASISVVNKVLKYPKVVDRQIQRGGYRLWWTGRDSGEFQLEFTV